MCGIAAIVAREDAFPLHVLHGMTEALVHRGPDDHGIAELPEDGAALGMRRLSIVDIEGGRQPMWSHDGTACLVFNGEIYNARELRALLSERGQQFVTDHSDTEVLIRGYDEWGDSLFARLNGMFAIAIWDRGRRKMIVARDRAGEKPLYIARTSFGYAVASEVKSFTSSAGVDTTLDPVGLEQFLAFDYVVAPRTPFANIRKLPPGHFAEIAAHGWSSKPFWRPNFGAPESAAYDGSATVSLDALLDDAVGRRMVADVPVGLFLSGGLDSTTVGYYMRRHSDAVHSFSIGFEEDQFDESRYASIAARALGTVHELEVFSADRVRELIPGVARLLDEPIGDQSIFPTYLLSMFTRQHVKVALGGDGSDELFMGYKSFTPLELAWRLAKVKPLAAAAAEAARRLGRRDRFRTTRGLPLAAGLDRSAIARQLGLLGAFKGSARWILNEDVQRELPPSVFDQPELDIAAGAAGVEGPVAETVASYLRGYLAEDILVKVDRASMAASLEVRAPFLDPAIIDFAINLPVKSRRRGLEGKLVVKELMRGRVPDELIARKKTGFGAPISAWLRGPLLPLVQDQLATAELERTGVFDPVAVRRLLADHVDGLADRGRQLWSVVLFQLWHDAWVRAEPSRNGADVGRCDRRAPRHASAVPGHVDGCFDAGASS